MKQTRRGFIEATGAVVAGAALGRSVGCSRPPSPVSPLSGAPGVELNVAGAALPDYSRDLERYLVRLTHDARERRKHVINAISTRRGLYKNVPNASVRITQAGEDPVQVLTGWASRPIS